MGWSEICYINMKEIVSITEKWLLLTISTSCHRIQTALAQELTKAPYNFDFLTLRDGYIERELEDSLTDNISKFLSELGKGFAM